MKQKKTVIIELGKCPFCHEVIIRLDDHGKPVHEKAYREAWLLLTDGSRMKVGICESCRDIMDEDMVKDLMVVHRDFWAHGLQEAFKQKRLQLDKQEAEQRAYYGKLDVVRFSKRERELD